MSQLPEIIWTAAIILMVAIIGNEDPLKEPYRVDVCLVKSGPNGEDVTTNLWNDQIERYFEKYPDSYCGTCPEPQDCPSNG